jgi:hypothetical protein
VLASVAILIWGLVPGYVVGWDLHVYENALHALKAGHDPYLDGIAVQRVFHAHLAEHLAKQPPDPTPFTYVYSPLTLLFLRFVNLFPVVLSNTIYWILYGLGVLAVILIELQAVEASESRIFLVVAPLALFFPGLLQQDVLFSGNVAYLLYGLVLGATYIGWKRGQWSWFYWAVLFASCCKAPMLTLLAIPVLSARKQWMWTGVTAAAGLALFAMQPLVWPSLFQHYLEAVELQFSFNRDFSSSPAGVLTQAVYDHVPYKLFSMGFYLFYAIPLALIMLYLSRRFFEGRFSLRQWIPVMLVGVILLNPRIMEYDVAPITIAMAIVMWRVFRRTGTDAGAIVGASLALCLLNWIARTDWRPTESVLLPALFAAGTWDLLTGRHAAHEAGDDVLEMGDGAGLETP